MGGRWPRPAKNPDTCRVLPMHVPTRITTDECKRESSSLSPSNSSSANVGYRVDFSLDELEGTNSRIIASCVRFDAGTFLVPQEQPVHLLFLRVIFNRLRQQSFSQLADGPKEDPTEERLPMEAFHRAFERLFFVLQDPKGFSVLEYDTNGDGFVSWVEFFAVYRKRNITVRLSVCERIFLTFDDPDSSMCAQVVSMVVLTIIVVSSCCFVLSTVDQFQVPSADGTEAPKPNPVLKRVDEVCLVLFCLEYLVRLATCWNVRTELFKKAKLLSLIVGFEPIKLPGPLMRVFYFMVTPTNVIDLAAILPAVLAIFIQSESGGFVVLRLIRLTRIFRVLKSPALIEPVVIIGRTLQQSTKALYVLLFNLLLGVVISGSLMYLAEGGTWDEATQHYLRRAGQQWNASSGQFIELYEQSPFQSIPHTFWWAMVTIATVGYGDENNYPKTAWGYTIAVLTMVFSLVMLALPVGVIGGTFSQVWSEFDAEKKREAEMVRQETFFVTQSMQRLDPDQMCRMMLIEVWDDSSMKIAEPRGKAQRKACGHRAAPFHFMGEAKLELELPSYTRVARQKTLPLQPNTELINRKVTGEITLRYEWTPAALLEDGALPRRLSFQSSGRRTSFDLGRNSARLGDDEPVSAIKGALQVTIVSADRLINLGNTGRRGMSNPYCMVFVYPSRPVNGGLLQPCVWRTPTAQRTLSPRWEVNDLFAYDWSIPKALEEQVEATGERCKVLPCERREVELNQGKLTEVVLLLRTLASELQQVKEEVRVLHGRLDWLSLDPADAAAQLPEGQRRSASGDRI